MMLSAITDPAGAQERRKRKLKRREYHNKVDRDTIVNSDFMHIFQGPDYLWHMDGYDKLKPFGFAIHGCIDGFVDRVSHFINFACDYRYSRRILWLHVGPSNNDPYIIAGYYLECVETVQGAYINICILCVYDLLCTHNTYRVPNNFKI